MNGLLCFHWDHLDDCDPGTEDWHMGTVMNFTAGVHAQIMWTHKHQSLCWTLKNSSEIQLIFFFCFFHPVLGLLNNGILDNSLTLGFLLFFPPNKFTWNEKRIKLDLWDHYCCQGLHLGYHMMKCNRCSFLYLNFLFKTRQKPCCSSGLLHLVTYVNDHAATQYFNCY